MTITVSSSLSFGVANRANMIKSAHKGGLHIGDYMKSPYPVVVDPVERVDVNEVPRHAFVKAAEHGLVEVKARQFSAQLMGPGQLNDSQVKLIMEGRGVLRRRD